MNCEKPFKNPRLEMKSMKSPDQNWAKKLSRRRKSWRGKRPKATNGSVCLLLKSPKIFLIVEGSLTVVLLTVGKIAGKLETDDVVRN